VRVKNRVCERVLSVAQQVAVRVKNRVCERVLGVEQQVAVRVLANDFFGVRAGDRRSPLQEWYFARYAGSGHFAGLAGAALCQVRRKRPLARFTGAVITPHLRMGRISEMAHRFFLGANHVVARCGEMSVDPWGEWTPCWSRGHEAYGIMLIGTMPAVGATGGRPVRVKNRVCERLLSVAQQVAVRVKNRVCERVLSVARQVAARVKNRVCERVLSVAQQVAAWVKNRVCERVWSVAQ